LAHLVYNLAFVGPIDFINQCKIYRLSIKKSELYSDMFGIYNRAIPETLRGSLVRSLTVNTL